MVSILKKTINTTETQRKGKVAKRMGVFTRAHAQEDTAHMMRHPESTLTSRNSKTKHLKANKQNKTNKRSKVTRSSRKKPVDT